MSSLLIYSGTLTIVQNCLCCIIQYVFVVNSCCYIIWDICKSNWLVGAATIFILSKSIFLFGYYQSDDNLSVWCCGTSSVLPQPESCKMYFSFASPFSVAPSDDLVSQEWDVWTGIIARLSLLECCFKARPEAWKRGNAWKEKKRRTKRQRSRVVLA